MSELSRQHFNRPPTEHYHPRFALKWATEHGSPEPQVEWLAWFATLDACKDHVYALGFPVEIFDDYVKQRGTLYPSGSLRWKGPAK